jgi:peptide-methionine (S)-S-oxide reductase
MPTFARRHALTLLAVAGLGVAALCAPASAQRIPTETATFAGGCFWCTESDFDKVDGVLSTTSGYMGGTTRNPTYRSISTGTTGHAEVVRIEFDPKRVSFEQLVRIFWRTIDPLTRNAQFCDAGTQYRTAIFYHSEAQKQAADKTRQEVAGRFQQPIVTEITAAAEFTAAEDYHQDFYKKDPGRYYSYRAGCGRDAKLKSLWGAEAGGKIATQ